MSEARGVRFVVADFVHEFVEQGDEVLVFGFGVGNEDRLGDFGPVRE
jgi:hypothetical protein